MKKIIILFIFFTMGSRQVIAQNIDSFLNAAANSLGNSMENNYMIVDIQKRAAGYYILKDNNGEYIIQIDLGSALLNGNNAKVISEKLIDLQVGTVLTSIKYSNVIFIKSKPAAKYSLLPPKFSQSYTIAKIETLVNDPSIYFMTVKKDNATGLVLSYFTTHHTPFKVGDKIYTDPFNNKVYATLVDHPGMAGPWYFPDIYEINFVANPVQSGILSSPGDNVQKSNAGTGSMWEILPDTKLTGMTGQLALQMPVNISYAHLKVFISGETKVAASLFGNSKCRLLPGNYDLMMDKYSIKNVPVEQGKTTRLKIGVLYYSPRGSVQIVDGNNQKISMAGPFKIALPPGTYYVDGKKDKTFIIKDGEVTEY